MKTETPSIPLVRGKFLAPLIRGVRGVSVFRLKKLSDWDQVVKFIIPKLKPGTIIALSGPLGAGKTTFVQHLAKALGVRSTPRSPTFSLVRSYRLHPTSYMPTRLLHVDAYRIEHTHDLTPLNLQEELTVPGTIMALEWPENIKKWLMNQPNKKIFISIKLHPRNFRTCKITGDAEEGSRSRRKPSDG